MSTTTAADDAPCPVPDADPDLPPLPEPVGPTDGCGLPRRGRLARVARWALPVVTAAALAAVVVTSGARIGAAVAALAHMQPRWAALAVAAEAASYLALSLMVRLLAGPLPNARRAAPLRLSLVLFGLGPVLPAAPAEGLMIAGSALRSRRLDPRRIAVLLGFSQWFVSRSLFTVAAIDAVVAVALGDVSGAYETGVIGAAALTGVILVATTWLSLRRRVVVRVASAALRVRYLRRCPPAAERRARGAAWHRILVYVAGSRSQRTALAVTASAAWVCDGLCMGLALGGMGVHLQLDQLLLAYSVGTVAASLPLLPGGIGVVETVTPLVLVHYGVHLPQALAGVLVYRCVSTFLPALLGAAAGVGMRAEPDAEPEVVPAPAEAIAVPAAGS
jgi:uncharacterized protein (TIRG00374 family)